MPCTARIGGPPALNPVVLTTQAKWRLVVELQPTLGFDHGPKSIVPLTAPLAIGSHRGRPNPIVYFLPQRSTVIGSSSCTYGTSQHRYTILTTCCGHNCWGRPQVWVPPFNILSSRSLSCL